MKKTKLLPLFLALGLVLSACSSEDSDNSSNATNSDESSSLFGNTLEDGDSSTSAEEMRLENFTGSIALQNNSEEKAVILGSRLVTGDNIETMMESSAYVILDASKILRVNETSQIEIIQENKAYDIYLSKGTVFFNVTSSLSEEESLEFHTNNVVTGVRGTSGIIHYDAVNQVTQIVVLTGSVTGTTISEEQSIEAGEVGIVTTADDGTVDFEILSLKEDEPKFFFSDDFIDTIQGDSDFISYPFSDALRNSHVPYETLYASVIAQYSDYQYNDIYPHGNVFFDASTSTATINSDSTFGYRFYDLNKDGIEEIILYNLLSYASDGGYYTEIYTLEGFTPILISSARDGGARQGILEYYDTDPIIIYRLFNADSAPTTFIHAYYNVIDNQLVEIPAPENPDDLVHNPPELFLIQPT